MNVIEINGLVKKYPGFTLGPLNLEVPQGAIVGFVGENGAGKSTTLRLILGLAHPDAGIINLLGQPAGADHPRAHERVGVVFDDISLPDSFTVKNAGEFGKRLYKSWDAQTYEGAIRHYESGIRTPGEAQLRKIAQALDVSPKMLEDHKITSARDLVGALLQLEDEFALVPDEDGSGLRIDPRAARAPKASIAIKAWGDMRQRFIAGEITQEEYDAWKSNF